MTRSIVVILSAVFLACPASGQTPEARIKDKVKGTVELRKETQEKEDAWARQQAELKARYEAAKAGIRSLEKERDILARENTALGDRVAELKRRLEESVRLEEGLEDALEATLVELERFVAADLPFLPEERATRIRSLKESLVLSDTSPAEKLRRLLEALQVECEYGDTVEAYQQKIMVNEEPVFADIFRLGRLSVFWQTPDGSRVGEYDRVDGRWVELPSHYGRSIRMAVEMARKQRPVELIRLPLGRINP
jgi:septal ring factor EnvC (AmiA/AmiB activator)